MFKKINFSTYDKSPLWNTIPEIHYSKTMHHHIEPYLEKHRTIYNIHRNPNQNIYCEAYTLKQPKGSVVISHGFTESCMRYYESIYYFLKSGYQVYILEYRGHGHSYRPYLNKTLPDYSLTHVESFDEYVKDLHCMIKTLVLPNNNELPLYLFAHSMGGAIAVLYLEEHPGIFEKAVLTAPMLGIKLKVLPLRIWELIAKLFVNLNKGTSYLPIHMPFNPVPNFKDSLCLSSARYHYTFNQVLQNKILQNSGASWSWAHSALLANRLELDEDACKKIKIPILLFNAQNDTLVTTKAQLKLLKQMGHGTFVYVPYAKHEMLLGKSNFLEKYWGIIFDFLSR